MKYSIFILLFICSLGFFTTAHAQFENLLQTDINVEIIPENPKPNDSIYATLTSSGTNINTANITWKINNKIQKTGIGEKTFDFIIGDTNTITTLGITIKTSSGEIIEKTISIKPVAVDLIWQSEGTIPPFYRGKSMMSHQNKMTFIAMPHLSSGNGVEISAKNLVYKWKHNGTVMDSSSGYGKNTYTFVSSLLSRPLNIEVEVTSLSTNGTGYASMAIIPIDPSILLYKKDPIHGIEFQKALQNTLELNTVKEMTVIGVPFFFGTLDPKAPELVYTWSINGAPINNNPDQRSQVFRQAEGTSGISNISLSIENAKKILQLASNNFNLMFGESGSQ